MNIPPTKRDEKISVIQKLSTEAALRPFLPIEELISKGYPIFQGQKLPFSGFTLEELNKKTDYELDNILRRFSCFKEFYDDQAEKMQPFNSTDCKADFVYWSKQPYWTIDEGIALILDRDPNKVSWGSVGAYQMFSPFAKKYKQIIDTAERYTNIKGLFNPTTPTAFLAWAKKMGYAIPSGLLDAINTFGIQVTDWEEKCKKTEQQLDKLLFQANELVSQNDDLQKAIKKTSEQRDALLSLYENLKKSFHECKTTLNNANDQIKKLDAENKDLKSQDSPLNFRSEKTYLNIIAVLLEVVEGKTYGFSKTPEFINRTQFIDTLAHMYQNYPGLSKRTLHDKLNRAKLIEK